MAAHGPTGGGPVHDFIDPLLGKAIPYGSYDLERNIGWVSVGQDQDTATFAVESLRRWWQDDGALGHAHAGRLLVCADGGGSNGYRLRLGKYELGRFATASGLASTGCPRPPGTSTWNKIEHRLFLHSSMNWPGRPRTSHEVIVDLIAATTTRQDLKVHAERDQGNYPTGVSVTAAQLAAVPLQPHDFHGEWNDTIAPGNPAARG